MIPEDRVEFSDRHVTILSLYPRSGFLARFTDLDLADGEVDGWRTAVKCGLATRQIIR